MYSIGETKSILFNSFLEVPEEENVEDGERNEHIALRKTLCRTSKTQDSLEELRVVLTSDTGVNREEVKADLNKQMRCCE